MFINKRGAVSLLIAFSILLNASLPLISEASVTYDQSGGTYTDDLASSAGILATSTARLDTDGAVRLTNGSGVITSPYQSSGYFITSTIIPTYLAEWGNITWNASTTASTSVKVQVLDSASNLYSNTLLPGNSAGFTDTTVDISALPIDRTAINDSGKIGGIRLKFTLSTTDSSVTPAVHDFSLSWTTRQGSMASTTLPTSGWPIAEGNSQATNHLSTTPDSNYRVLRWSIDQGNDYGGQTVLSSGDLIYNKTQGGTMDGSSFTEGTLSAIDKSTGNIEWSRDISGFAYSSGFITLGENGDIYSFDIYHDRLMAYDSSGTPKWTYNFGSGHGNTHVNIGPDGKIYVVHTDDDSFTVYAFNANGTVAWSTNQNPPNNLSVQSTSLSNDGSSIYVGTSIISGFVNTGAGKLYSISTADGSVEWTYDTGDISFPIVGSDDTIYAFSSNSASFRKRVTALNADGTLKWERSIGTSTDYWSRGTLADDVLILERGNSSYPSSGGIIEGLSLTDGSLMWSDTIASQPDVFGSGLYSDASGYMIRPSVYTSTTSLEYYDFDQTLKWKWEYPTASQRLAFTSPDDDGSIFTTLYDESAREALLLGFAPWNLNVSAISAVSRGSAIDIDVTTNMPETDPVSGEANAMQAIMADGTKVALTFDSSSNGVSTWTGSYTVPEDSDPGVTSFTVEAAAAYTITDTAVSFTSVPLNSGNTGIRTSASYEVKRPTTSGSRETSGGSGGGSNNVKPSNPVSTTTATTTPTSSENIVDIFLKLKLSLGSQHDMVFELQKYLNQSGYTVAVQGPGSPGKETRYFGPATNAALQKYLGKNNQIKFTKSLRPGMTDPDVIQLQKILNSFGLVVSAIGPGSVGNETAFYGRGTASAVKLFQEKYKKEILEPLGFTSGTGIFGESTRTFLNSLLAK